MAELMATMVVGPLVSMVKEKASSYLLDQYNVMEGMEEQHETLKRKLPAIMDVIADAEEQAAAHREGAKAWLQALRKVAYQANDVFDEFKYEALRREAKKKGHYKKLGFDVIKLFPTHNRVVFRYRMGNKLRQILAALEVLIIEMHAFRFEFRPQPPMPKDWRQTDSNIIDHQEIASKSRGKEKEEVVNKLIGDQVSNSQLMVLPIVGMGGLGKTTLAQLVYNDSEVKKHFQLQLWVCVSDNFEVDLIAKSIVEAKEKSSSNSSEKSPLERLKEAVSGKRYLLVLDDVWNRDVNKWGKLKSSLQHGGSGSAVLTTTRDRVVAKLMADTTHEPYDITGLHPDFIKEIIEARAFSSKKERDAKLVEMVGDIAKRCAGSPLAATAVGSLLHTKTSVDEWNAVLSKSAICDDETEILPILKLSYNGLPPHIRQCFAFCAIFPKDYEIDVEKLIQLWMANGFIPEQHGVCPEITGKKIFMDLVSRSCFQDVNKVPFEVYDIEDPRVTCKIHDLMHDLAQSSMGTECATISDNNFPYSARHLFISVGIPEEILNTSMEKGSMAVQTLICTRYAYQDRKHLSKYRSIRALRIYRGSLLKPKYLHHLRYLDLSDRYMEALPEEISILYNLQTLDLSNCEKLRRLPKEMKYMTGLRHLYIHGCDGLKSIPSELGNLTSLQTLTCFVAGTGSGCSNVRELRQLDQLGGPLELRQLENVAEADAKAAHIGNKKDLTRLTLRWTTSREKEEQDKSTKMLEALKPHDGLKVLDIYGYGGGTYPTWIWMNTLQQMVKLTLSGCKNLKELPPLWQLPALKVLSLEGLESLNCLCSGDAAVTPFMELKELSLRKMPNFETWWVNELQGEESIFPQVEKLSIYNCERLTALPKALMIKDTSGGVINKVWRSAFPALKKLKLDDMQTFQRWEAVQGEEVTFPRLEKLVIGRCPELTSLPEAPNLSELEIHRGSQQMLVPVANCIVTASSLSKLELYIDDRETAWPDGDSLIQLVDGEEKQSHNKSPSTLTVMELYRCNVFFSHSSALALWACLVQLEDLEIRKCEALVHWPEEVFQSLKSLRSLRIRDCNNLTGRRHASSEQSSTERSSVLPASLKSLFIDSCPKLESIAFSKQLDTSTSSRGGAAAQDDRSALIQGSGSCNDATASTPVPKLPSSTRHHFLPCLESLIISECNGLTEVLDLPPSIETLTIFVCDNLRALSGQLDAVQTLSIVGCSSLKSLESLLGELALLEELYLSRCKSLVSLPNGPQAYSSLRSLTIQYCPRIKLLPQSLQQRLGDLKDEDKRPDAHFYHGNLQFLYLFLVKC
ncbi:hypothetical protein BDA96_08G113100 [Sorghum bicolor]|uniref:Ig-like domain-containing protein n=1 Tax=Sorghum bicolor TaxID=4558 RepID=A0A921U7S0_SORBI|nr:hypothetical protein BDA96_08G113100 [Sorghum bicolor]